MLGVTCMHMNDEDRRADFKDTGDCHISNNWFRNPFAVVSLSYPNCCIGSDDPTGVVMVANVVHDCC